MPGWLAVMSAALPVHGGSAAAPSLPVFAVGPCVGLLQELARCASILHWLCAQGLCPRFLHIPAVKPPPSLLSPPCRGLHVPSALLLVVAGVAMALVSDPTILHSLHLGPSRPQILLPSGEQWRRGVSLWCVFVCVCDTIGSSGGIGCWAVRFSLQLAAGCWCLSQHSSHGHSQNNSFPHSLVWCAAVATESPLSLSLTAATCTPSSNLPIATSHCNPPIARNMASQAYCRPACPSCH